MAVARRKGEYLLMKRSSETSSTGYWNFPAGRIEDDEEPGEAALRELEEETGLTGEITGEGGTFLNRAELGVWRLHPFLVEIEKGRVRLDENHSRFRWVEKHEIESFETLGALKSLESLGLLE